jgi:hypothetical protein
MTSGMSTSTRKIARSVLVSVVEVTRQPANPPLVTAAPVPETMLQVALAKVKPPAAQDWQPKKLMLALRAGLRPTWLVRLPRN